MGARECFIYSTNTKYPVERLAELLLRHPAFHGEDARCWLVCKVVAVRDLHKDSVTIWGTQRDIAPFDLKERQEALCVGHESGVSVRECLPFRLWKDLVVIDGVTLCDMPYEQVWKDEPVVVNGKEYFAELEPARPNGLEETLERAAASSGKTGVAGESSLAEKREFEVGI